MNGSKTFCEFFAGIGLVREGLEASGWSCIYANDIDAKKKQLYEGRFGAEDHFHLGDVWNRDEVLGRIPTKPFLATASFPCIDLSLAGHWKGFEGDHSSSFFGFANVIEALENERRPSVVMLENVTGFITSQGGKDFDAAAKTLGRLGYWLDAFVLDAKFFVPQSRPRVFVVGVHEALEPPMMRRRSADEWMTGEWTKIIRRSSKSLRPTRLVELIERIELPTGWSAFDVPLPKVNRCDIGKLIDLDEDQEWWDLEAVEKHRDMMSENHREFVDGLIRERKDFVGTIFRRRRHDKTRAEVRSDGMAGCLRTPRGGSARQIVIAVSRGKLRMRWMSAREYARLQGADEFPLVENVIQNLFGFGDAVCVPVIRFVDKHVLSPLADWALTSKVNGHGRQSDSRTTPPNNASGKRKKHLA